MENEVDYEAVLADLEAKKAKIEAAIAGVKMMLGKAVSASGGPLGVEKAQTSISFDTFYSMTVIDSAKKYLTMVAKDAKSTKEILKALDSGGCKTTYSTLSSSLSRAYTAGEIACPKRGMWGLPEWYPGNVPKRKKSSKDSEETKEDKAKE